ncbi:MAG: hypothetical protein IPI38_00070 [Gemmatimonadetes bacterium]|nr:hypothetical protein [Gemmatimonadota bacterium]
MRPKNIGKKTAMNGVGSMLPYRGRGREAHQQLEGPEEARVAQHHRRVLGGPLVLPQLLQHHLRPEAPVEGQPEFRAGVGGEPAFEDEGVGGDPAQVARLEHGQAIATVPAALAEQRFGPPAQLGLLPPGPAQLARQLAHALEHGGHGLRQGLAGKAGGEAHLAHPAGGQQLFHPRRGVFRHQQEDRGFLGGERMRPDLEGRPEQRGQLGAELLHALALPRPEHHVVRPPAGPAGLGSQQRLEGVKDRLISGQQRLLFLQPLDPGHELLGLAADPPQLVHQGRQHHPGRGGADGGGAEQAGGGGAVLEGAGEVVAEPLLAGGAGHRLEQGQVVGRGQMHQAEVLELFQDGGQALPGAENPYPRHREDHGDSSSPDSSQRRTSSASRGVAVSPAWVNRAARASAEACNSAIRSAVRRAMRCSSSPTACATSASTPRAAVSA